MSRLALEKRMQELLEPASESLDEDVHSTRCRKLSTGHMQRLFCDQTVRSRRKMDPEKSAQEGSKAVQLHSSPKIMALVLGCCLYFLTQISSMNLGCTTRKSMMSQQRIRQASTANLDRFQAPARSLSQLSQLSCTIYPFEKMAKKFADLSLNNSQSSIIRRPLSIARRVVLRYREGRTAERKTLQFRGRILENTDKNGPTGGEYSLLLPFPAVLKVLLSPRLSSMRLSLRSSRVITAG